MAVNLEETYLRHADDFALRLEAQKAYKRFLHAIAHNNVNAGLHQQANGGCATPGQQFPREFEVTLAAVSLRDKKMVPPGLPLTFPLKAKLMRPGQVVDALLSDANPCACQQRNQTAVVLDLDKRAL